MTAPIIPDFLVARAQVGVIFDREIAEAEHACNETAAVQLLRLRGEVLATIGPESGKGTMNTIDYRIVVLQRGWVVVGKYSRDGDDITIVDARVIRRWGTTKGLGELVNGPTSKTVLDDAGTVRAHVLGIVLTVDVQAEAWTR